MPVSKSSDSEPKNPEESHEYGWVGVLLGGGVTWHSTLDLVTIFREVKPSVRISNRGL